MSHDATSSSHAPFVGPDGVSWSTGRARPTRSAQAQTWYEFLTGLLVQEDQSERSGAVSSEAR